MVAISLRDFVDEMQVFSGEHHAYLNKITGELITITNEDIAVIEVFFCSQVYSMPAMLRKPFGAIPRTKTTSW
jgi:hypothetical protein